MPDGSGSTVAVGGVAGERLRSFVERIERMEEEKAALAGDIRETFAELKGAGFNVRVTKELLKLRKLDAADRREQEELLDLYMRALEM